MADHEPPVSEESTPHAPETAAPADSIETDTTVTADEPGEKAVPVLPDRIRVHALAKLLGVKSKQVLATLTELGAEARSAHSNLGRETAESVRDALTAKESGAPAPEASETVAPAPEAVAEPAPAQTPSLFTNADPATPPPAPAAAAEPAPAAQVPLFLQPDAESAEQERRQKSEQQRKDADERRKRKQEAAQAAQAETAQAQTAEVQTADATGDASAAADSSVENDSASAGEAVAEKDAAKDEDDDSQPRRRRRGRRGRGRGRGEQNGPDGDSEKSESDDTDSEAESGKSESAERNDDDSAQDEPAAETDAEQTDAGDGTDEKNSADDKSDDGDEGGSSRRRRRRRRRKVSGDGSSDSASSEDDPPNTVVHEREPRNKRSSRDKDRDEVQGITGSTRLEAKRQRRRDGRDAGRRRPPILTESEFLARRESVDRVMVVREKAFPDHPTATQVAVLEDGVLVEHFVTSTSTASMVGNVYLGRVQNVLPSMEAAFVDIGRGRNGVLYAGEVNWEAAGLGGKERKIEQALKPGDQVLVQVSKDPVGHKGARLTTQISLAGRFLVYVPGGSSTGISRKLPDTERKRLKEILRDIVPADAGVIIRTASEGVAEAELARDVERLQAQWNTISEAAEKKDGGRAKDGSTQTLYEEPDLLVKVVRDLFNEDFSKLVIEGERAWSTVENYIQTVAPDLLPRVERYDNTGVDVFGAHRIDEQLAKALDRKVWLPSGGTLVIDRTEAMTVVDVNTGKFTGSGGNLEETVTRNNLEAAEEIVRQMRLRDIGGMIVVDFIDMVLESNRDLVLRRLTESLGRDRTRHQVSEVTSLGLVQMTRKKLGTGLVEAFSSTCEHCHGRGIVVHSYPVEVSSSDDGGQRSGSRGESSSRKRRGRDKSSNNNEPAQDKGAQQHEHDVDSSVKRAHPAALAMASHHHDDVEAPADSAATGGSTAVSQQLPEPAAEPVAETVAEPVVEPVVESQPSDEPAPAPADTAPADTAPAEKAPAKATRRRRVARAAAAPPSESTGTVVVIPASDGAAPAGDTESTPAFDLIESPVVPPRPRRRRASGRPAGPPVDVDA